MSTFWPNGVGGSLGDPFVLEKPLQVSGNIYYLDSVTGSDSFTGKERERPFATLAAAVTAAADDDIIVVLSTHTQTLTAQQSLAKRLMIVGEGSAGGIPTARFTMNAAAATMFNISAINVELRNLYIAPNAQDNPLQRINVAAAMCRITGCYIECGAHDQVQAVVLAAGADKARIKNTTFISTTTTTTLPGGALSSTAAITDLELESVTFDNGAKGFGTTLTFASGAITRLKAESISLLNGADALLNAATTGWFNVGTATGGGRVTF